ncbi:hypothetical protein PUR59_34785 [Streptomyces sp. SP18ES09]|uniref:DUF6426 family protein n=1 Tax=Streptomyces sp. SP18ES09 TaxID=3002532 RepID=UPI002E76CFBA|nr:DUF6426 family protein [Streptomyces sp. SP18ES09]MEE1820165.1 hypothetical protein [Streptomyces sp. SP18ES09]
MKLRKTLVAAALGATVLTVVPAVAAPYTAYACEDNQSNCDEHNEDPYPEPEDPWGDPGGIGGGGGGAGDGGGGGWSGELDVSSGAVGSPADATLPQVVVDGTATRPPSPMDPAIPPVSWGGGGGGGGSNAVTVQAGQKKEVPQNCYRNANSMPVRINTVVKYQVSYQVSANITANGAEVLSASLGAQLNTQIERSFSVDVTLNPGQSWALFVEYQTYTYAVTSTSWWGNTSTEYVEVTQPTGKITSRWC